MGGLVKQDRALGTFAEHAVDDTNVEVEVCVQRRSEALDIGMLGAAVDRHLRREHIEA